MPSNHAGHPFHFNLVAAAHAAMVNSAINAMTIFLIARLQGLYQGTASAVPYADREWLGL